METEEDVVGADRVNSVGVTLEKLLLQDRENTTS